MLPSGNRMRRRDDFTLAVRRGRRAGRPTVVVHLLRPDEAPAADAPPLVGFIVARTVGNAVVRNRARRRLRHLMRPHLDLLPAGSLLVVRANPRAGTARPDELAADLESALGRLLRPASKGRR
ncbi:ribonuclease P protein component [Actinomadura bangladeshensis]|uniref:Ribonuclease P protein component n=1 Tax=Actinomadura bangladeshensis TaxID=453573 RepID=A0A4R4N4P8_9ACTN|nr:ribonuclease P protein component [Actinomadura bangladeshensis]TDC03749.1 ribonuclease P protein component [Actinomadura bangladeshensis]